MSDAPGPVTPPPAPEWPPFPPPQAGPAGGVYPLDMGRIFELTFSLFRYRWQTFLGATLVIMIPASILLALLQFVSGPEMSRWYEQLLEVARGRPLDLMASFPWQAFVLGWLSGIVAGAVGFIAEGAVVHAAAVTYGGSRPTVGDSLSKALSRLPSLLGVFVLMFLAIIAIVLVAVGLGAVLLGVTSGPGSIGLQSGPGAFLAIVLIVASFAALVFVSSRWIMAVQGVVLENMGAVDALRRSWRLVAGSTWRIVGYTLVFGLVFGLIAVLLSIVPTFIIAPELVAPRFDVVPVLDPVRTATASFITSLISLLLMPFPAIGFTLLYFDLRWRHGERVPAPGGGETAGAQVVPGEPTTLG